MSARLASPTGHEEVSVPVCFPWVINGHHLAVSHVVLPLCACISGVSLCLQSFSSYNEASQILLQPYSKALF
jgi:hypothetical protein